MSIEIDTGVRSLGPAGGMPPDPLEVLAQRGDIDALRAYLGEHPGQRDALDSLLVRASRYGDVYALAEGERRAAGPQAAAPVDTKPKPKPVDYDTPVWTKTKVGDGPAFPGRKPSDTSYRLSESAAWGGMVAQGTVSESEQRVISRMADNEGRLDSVQSYDNQIVTVGSMQKTINPQGRGEFARQVFEFSQSNPDAYASLFTEQGWSVENSGKGTGDGAYTMSLTVDGTKMTGNALSAYIKDEQHPDHWMTALSPLQNAGRDAAFQAKQIGDFVARLDSALAKVPASAVKGQSYTRPISAYVTSEQGAALVLDESVNRPAHVPNTFGKALDAFFADNPKAERDPTLWTAAQRATYEPRIVSKYEAQRLVSRMTDPDQRAAHITGKGTTLSADPGSFVRVSR
ncbi:hypothetical protein PX554_17770 [Sphingomonas sp. H39-1-10]|uniref:hypothetical protein n=1 Tax=Sphingomonas TaxID=13687 RepID=UPI00088AE4A3|nr:MULTISPECIES: hypothetical protein [Sphingomonas]MDF0489986.1 hypothetical protein [Sphingomonas pollutisoli]SDA36201.1 hypothetical protein SAMN03159340_03565 [Sphingomonas sp. NFR15]